ncbi:MAG: hypothetical protein ACR2L2_17665 [Acidobacteriota bacterium]
MTYFALELEAPVIRAQAEKVNLIDLMAKGQSRAFMPYLGCSEDAPRLH